MTSRALNDLSSASLLLLGNDVCSLLKSSLAFVHASRSNKDIIQAFLRQYLLRLTPSYQHTRIYVLLHSFLPVCVCVCVCSISIENMTYSIIMV